MYLFIFEDGEMRSVDNVKETDLSASDDGYIDIVRIAIEGMTVFYERYKNGNWEKIEEI